MSTDNEEKEFFRWIFKILNKFKKQRLHLDEIAGDILEVNKKIEPALIKAINNNGKDTLKLKLNMIVDKPCLCDLRREMHDNLIEKAFKKGYVYCVDESTESELFFKKRLL